MRLTRDGWLPFNGWLPWGNDRHFCKPTAKLTRAIYSLLFAVVVVAVYSLVFGPPTRPRASGSQAQLGFTERR
jgi:hypothetical protein